MEHVCLYATAALRRIDECAQQVLRIDAFALMERAGRHAWKLARARWPEARRIVVLCGPGNNGGDGWVLASLADTDGFEVRVHTDVPVGQGSPALLQARARCPVRADSMDAFCASLIADPPDLVIDALFGIGLSRALDPGICRAIDALNDTSIPVLALDVPSGVDADTGSVAQTAVRADVTLSFLAAKRGLHTGAALDHVGVVEQDDLGMPAQELPDPDAVLCLPAMLRLGRRPRDAHKGRFGHVLAIGGDTGMAGAVALCAMAALRSGAGKVSLISRACHMPILTGLQPELMAHGDDGLHLLADADIVAIGPGLGCRPWGRALLEHALASGKPLVIDADGLNLLHGDDHLPQGSVLTPHPGEAARLLGVSIGQVQADRFTAARHLAQRHGATVVLKGAGTVVATPRRPEAVIAAGNPGMASAGMGDVLTGVIAALRAQGHGAHDAAVMGALWHGCAGDAAAQDGERGLLASDLLAALRRLGDR